MSGARDGRASSFSGAVRVMAAAAAAEVSGAGSSSGDTSGTGEEERMRRLFQTCDGDGDGFMKLRRRTQTAPCSPPAARCLPRAVGELLRRPRVAVGSAVPGSCPARGCGSDTAAAVLSSHGFESRNGLYWKEPEFQPPTESGCPRPHPAWPWAPPGMGHLQFLWAACASLHHPPSKQLPPNI